MEISMGDDDFLPISIYQNVSMRVVDYGGDGGG